MSCDPRRLSEPEIAAEIERLEKRQYNRWVQRWCKRATVEERTVIWQACYWLGHDPEEEHDGIRPDSGRPFPRLAEDAP